MKLIIDENNANERLDVFLTNNIENISREKIKSLIKNENILVNNKVVNKPSYLLNENDIIEVKLDLTKQDKELSKWVDGVLPEIIFECDDYYIINKYSGLTVHPGSGNIDKTLVNIMIANNFELSRKDTIRPGIVHRLDKNTSGIMIIAKNDLFHNFIEKQFQNGEVEKKYVLISSTKFKEEKGIIDAPIGRDPKQRKLMNVQSKNSKPAKSIFQIIEKYKYNDYVEFIIQTGRTHQIRVHSKFIGSPVLNDLEYSSSSFDKEFGQFLHAKEIKFKNMKGEEVYYSANLPEEFNNKLEELRKDKL